MRILIVEDEPLVAMETEYVLEDHGCVIAGFATTVASALKLIASSPPDAAVLDLNLGGESTLGVAEALERLLIPFIIVTGYGHATLSEPSLRNYPIVAKPWRDTDLLTPLSLAVNTANAR